MALNIKDPATDALARRVAELSGESITRTVHSALETRLAELLRKADVEARKAFMDRVAEDARRRREARESAGSPPPPSEDEIFGWDSRGLPT
ncbi:MAG TPA: type II toxin-antitoxin system VapB family antitoxin [Actinomycetales bacterium]|uniref:type II toxin-antitoxin system VapB family antitoxin n=1 Tax=Dietzia sp. 179-F 9C3 NHS TaxID=3374295 RepID=UPI0017773532|nr:type II toxin-antitoxin system VapB family antitoxin [Actinomycetales bacterium]